MPAEHAPHIQFLQTLLIHIQCLFQTKQAEALAEQNPAEFWSQSLQNSQGRPVQVLSRLENNPAGTPASSTN